jgi:hypothetical protein
MRLSAVMTLVLLLSGAALAQGKADSPEPTIFALVKAMFANDVESYNRVTIPDARRSRLTTGGRMNAAALERLEQNPGSLQMNSRRPFLYRGREASPDASGNYPVGTTALYSVANGGNSMVAPLVRQADGWKVDVRWWLAMMDIQTGPEPRNTPAYAARALTASLAAMDRESAAKFATPGASLDLLFRGAQREPSGVFDALAMEMPLVELRPGEFFPIDERVVEGGTSPDQKLLLGLFGVVEIPFVVRRVGGDWRVEPQSFYKYFNR